MKNLQDVLQYKQKQLAGLRREVDALELTYALLKDDSTAMPVDKQAVEVANLDKVLKSWP